MGSEMCIRDRVQLLGAGDELARSVPFIWANSPSPYGPVALGLAGVVSAVTSNSILLGVIAHRLLSIAGIMVAGWGHKLFGAALPGISRICPMARHSQPTDYLAPGRRNP